MILWIVNPFDDLPHEQLRPGRYTTLAETLRDRGHSVVWWSSNYSHGFKKFRAPCEEFEGITIRQIRTCAYRRNVSLRRLINHRQFACGFYETARQALASSTMRPPDRIMVSLPPLGVAEKAFALRAEFGAQIIVDIQDAWPEAFFRFIPGGGPVKRWITEIVFGPWQRSAATAFRGADRVSAVAESYLNRAKESGAVGPFNRTYLGVSQPAGFRAKEETKKGPVTFVYVGSISANYDLVTLLPAAAGLAEQGHDFRVIVAGMGDQACSFREKVRAMGLGNIIDFKGFATREAVWQLLSEADVGLNLVLPDSCIAMPNKVGEYLTAGLPIVNGLPGELADILKCSGAGEFYAAKSAESLARAMEKYLRSPAHLRAGKKAALCVGKQFHRRETYGALCEFFIGKAVGGASQDPERSRSKCDPLPTSIGR